MNNATRRNDPVRDQLWADIYRIHTERKTIDLRAAEAANCAVELYDRRKQPAEFKEPSNDQ